MKKRTLRTIGSGFTYGALFGMILFLLNTPADAVFLQTLKILLISVICAVVSGIAFTAILFLAEFIRSKKYNPYRKELEAGGKILIEDFARRLLGDKLVSGWLFLTEKSLSFHSGKDEIRCIPNEDISAVEITDPKRGQITVSMVNLEVETFTVSDALAWFNAIGGVKPSECPEEPSSPDGE